MGFIDDDLREQIKQGREEETAQAHARIAKEITDFKSPENIAKIVDSVRDEVIRICLLRNNAPARVFLPNSQITQAIARDKSCTDTLLLALQSADGSVVGVRLRVEGDVNSQDTQHEASAKRDTIHVDFG